METINPIGQTRSQLHELYCKNHERIESWYAKQASLLPYPIYSSYDIRNAGYKITNVDANIYPAGFNNICPQDQETAPALFDRYLKLHYPKNPQRILLVTEEHTQNPYYWQNVATIKKLIEQGGRRILLSWPRKLDQPLRVTTAFGEELEVVSGDFESAALKEFQPDLIISNNDFSDQKIEWLPDSRIPMNPPRELGWYQRKKSNYFRFYNKLVGEFCALLEVDPFLMQIKTEMFPDFDIESPESLGRLADRVDAVLAEIKQEYQKHQIATEPFVFVKNNAGTYGLGVLRVGSGAEVRALNYKNRKKMKAAKGGREIQEVIIQEGIPSVVRSDGATAEPVIYMVGCHLAGGFLRTHSEKSDQESLNSPGAVYKRMCMSDLMTNAEKCPSENVYGWSARLGLLAIALEAEELKVTFKDFIAGPCRIEEAHN